jgi:hypothetical protein
VPFARGSLVGSTSRLVSGAAGIRAAEASPSLAAAAAAAGDAACRMTCATSRADRSAVSSASRRCAWRRSSIAVRRRLLHQKTATAKMSSRIVVELPNNPWGRSVTGGFVSPAPPVSSACGVWAILVILSCLDAPPRRGNAGRTPFYGRLAHVP